MLRTPGSKWTASLRLGKRQTSKKRLFLQMWTKDPSWSADDAQRIMTSICSQSFLFLQNSLSTSVPQRKLSTFSPMTKHVLRTGYQWWWAFNTLQSIVYQPLVWSMTHAHKPSQACQFNIRRLSFMTVFMVELTSVSSDSLSPRNNGSTLNLYFQRLRLFAAWISGFWILWSVFEILMCLWLWN